MARVSLGWHEWQSALLVCLSAACLFACGDGATVRVDPISSSVDRIVSSEDLILALTPEVSKLSKAILDLEFPGDSHRSLFKPRLSVIDLVRVDVALEAVRLGSLDVASSTWPLAVRPVEVNGGLFQMFRPLLEGVSYFEHAKFYLIDGEFDATGAFRTTVGLEALALTADGVWRGITATQEVRWARGLAVDRDSVWQIDAWHLRSLEVQDTPHRLFSERLDWAVNDTDVRRRLRESLHETYLVERSESGVSSLPTQYTRGFSVDGVSLHPGVSVVDIDGDGFDDLYVMQRWGSNQLLRNRGDGTLEEVAQDLGLDIRGTSSSGIFADFDNDGDPDLVLGRGLERSLYLVNEDGQFKDRSKTAVASDMPFLVTAVSATDYNNDGLMDVYLSTYGRLGSDGLRSEAQLRRYLSAGDADELIARIEEKRRSGSSEFIDAVGPPNVLLVNLGDGHFEVARENAQLQLWRNTLQATWADFDGDGDQDLYVANDYAPDNLLRNDGAAGFVDVTHDIGGEAMLGFGMGASWGDYDQDGRQDLYVSNMYSKAGTRITAQIEGIDSRFTRSAQGNLLFRNAGDNFEVTSGLHPPALAVAKAGWAWGGQFVDVNNDTFLDIYVSSGYFTAPAAVATDVDI